MQFFKYSPGFLAEFLEDVFKITVFPFLLAVPLFVSAGEWANHRSEFRLVVKFDEPGTWMCFKWHNSMPPDAESTAPSFVHRLKSAWRLMQRSSPTLLLGVLAFLLETCQKLTMFVWTPIFAHLTRIYRFRPAFGGAYSAFAAASLLGVVFSRMLAGKNFGYAVALMAASGNL